MSDTAVPDVPAPVAALQADYFDGASARAHRVLLRIDDGMLRIEGAHGLARRLPLAEVQ